MADGSCIATLGSTSVLVTAVSKASHGPSQGFFPLTVDFRQVSCPIRWFCLKFIYPFMTAWLTLP